MRDVKRKVAKSTKETFEAEVYNSKVCLAIGFTTTSTKLIAASANVMTFWDQAAAAVSRNCECRRSWFKATRADGSNLSAP